MSGPGNEFFVLNTTPDPNGGRGHGLALDLLKRFGPISAIILGLVLVFWLDLDRYISFQTLQRNHEELRNWVAGNMLWSALVFGALYAASVSLSLPGGALMTVASGYLFGILWGTVIAATSATIGATVIFLAARNASRQFIQRRAGRTIRRIESGFKENMTSYMFFLRFVPVFPFFAVNLAMAFLGVPVRLYLLTTFFGILPGSAVYAGVGNGLGAVLETGREPSMGIIFEPAILLPILALAVMSLMPVAYRSWRQKNNEARTH